jgi:hypothetical protein
MIISHEYEDDPDGDAAEAGSDGLFVTSNLHAEMRKVFLA